MNDKAIEVCNQLVEYQRDVSEKAQMPDCMPGNKLWSDRAMVIVRAAQEAIRIDNEPITAEWLESVGATGNRTAWFFEIEGHLLKLGFTPRDGVWVEVWHNRTYRKHIKTRQQFRDAYRVLSRKGLGE